MYFMDFYIKLKTHTAPQSVKLVAPTKVPKPSILYISFKLEPFAVFQKRQYHAPYTTSAPLLPLEYLLVGILRPKVCTKGLSGEEDADKEDQFPNCNSL